MSPRAAWQLEQFGFRDVHDFVLGKVHWLASGRPSVRAEPADRVVDHLETAPLVVQDVATIGEIRGQFRAADDSRIIVVNDAEVVVGTLRVTDVDGIDSQMAVADVMSRGPTTIRPHEDAAAVRARMERRNVSSVIVTAPTGRLLGSAKSTSPHGSAVRGEPLGSTARRHRLRFAGDERRADLSARGAGASAVRC